MLKTIIIADDHILLRNALSSIINTFPGFSVINLASNGAELMKAIGQGSVPDIVILDLNMPIMDGYDTARELNEKYPLVKILILTMYDTEVPLIRLLKLGVRGFLKKDIHPDELKYALISVAQDGFYYSHQTIGKLAHFFKRNSDKNTSVEKDILSDIEIEFLKMASTEMTYKEIAVANETYSQGH